MNADHLRLSVFICGCKKDVILDVNAGSSEGENERIGNENTAEDVSKRLDSDGTFLSPRS